MTKSAVLAVAALAASVAVPASGDPFMVDTSIIYVPMTDRQCEPTAAFDGANYLVVWEDHRDGVDVYGARVTPAGIVLDRTGLAISTAAGAQQSPVVAFDGTNYLVVWHDTRNGSLDDIYAARVTPAGAVLDRNGIAISRATGIQYAPAVAFSGSTYLVVWTDGRRGGDQTDIFAARITTTGAVLDTAGIPVYVGPYLQHKPGGARLRRHLRRAGQPGRHGARLHRLVFRRLRPVDAGRGVRRHQLLRRVGGCETKSCRGRPLRNAGEHGRLGA
jgi:hypothetical protein